MPTKRAPFNHLLSTFHVIQRFIFAASSFQFLLIVKLKVNKEVRILASYLPYECDTKMTEPIATIDDIVKFGLQPNLSVPDRDKMLERSLIKIYSLYFDISYQFDNTDYPDFDKSYLPNIRHNVETNFQNLGSIKLFWITMILTT